MPTPPARPTPTPTHEPAQSLLPHLHLGTWLALIGLAWLAYYVLACTARPFAACRRCDGNGKYRKPTGRAWHPCRHCKGTGHRLRLGRHVTNYLHRTRAGSTRASEQRSRLDGIYRGRR